MEAIVCKNFGLYPIVNRHLILVIARGGRFLWRPRLGFYDRADKTYFVVAFGKLYVGMRLVDEEA